MTTLGLIVAFFFVAIIVALIAVGDNKGGPQV